MNWLKLELKLIFSGGAAKFSFALVIFSALMAIYFGGESYRQLSDKQNFSQTQFEAQLAEYQQRETRPDAGYLGYYLLAATEWDVTPWSTLFIGQSHSSYSDISVRSLALQGQIYAQEIINPSQYKAGRLDLGFVIIYLFPLLLGVLTVTTLSEERGANRWRLLSVLAKSGAHFIWQRVILSTALVLILAVGVISLAVIWLDLNLGANYFYIVISSCIYLIFWALLISLIITLGKNSVFNTLFFVAIWLLLSVILPASIQLYLDNSNQQHPALKATLEQRMVMNNGWDNEPKLALEAFVKQYPEYQSFILPPQSGSWPWYFAQQHMSDLAVASDWAQYLAQNQQKLDVLKKLSWISPATLLQLEFNELAGSSGQAHLSYIQDVENYHQRLREYLYGYIYQDKTIDQNILDNFPRFHSTSTTTQNWQGLTPLILIIGLFIMLLINRDKKLGQFY